MKRRPSVGVVSQEQLRQFGELLKRIREARGWSLREAAARADLTPETIRALEDGKKGSGVYTTPGIHTLKQISEGYGIALPLLTKAAYGEALGPVDRPPVPDEIRELMEAAEILARNPDALKVLQKLTKAAEIIACSPGIVEALAKAAGKNGARESSRAKTDKTDGRTASFKMIPEFERILQQLLSSD